MIKAKTKRPYKSLIKAELPDNPTADDVLEHLFGDADGWVNSDYEVRQYEEVKTNFIQRVLTPFVWVAFMLVICPLNWLISGRFGFSAHSKFYKAFVFLTNSK